MLQTLKPTSEKRKKSSLAKKKSFIGSATRVNFTNILRVNFLVKNYKYEKSARQMFAKLIPERCYQIKHNDANP